MLNHKKLLSAALACAMATSLAVPTFAASSSESTTNRSLKVTAAYQAVTINVVVPTTGTVIINPYSLPVTIGTNTSEKKVDLQQQIVTKPLAVKNQGGIDLDMNISTTVATTGNLKLVEAAVADPNDGSVTANSAYVVLDIEPTEITGDKDTVTDALITEEYEKMYDDQNTNHWGDTTNGYQQVLKGGTVATKKVITLKQADTDEDSGAFSAYAKGGIALIGFTGDCTIEPKTAWTTKDGLTCTIAFTFTPAATDSTEETTD
jgi:hypothetical protein